MSILDQFGRPIDFDALDEQQTAQLTTLPSQWDSHPANGLTPAKLNRILIGAENGDLYTQMAFFRDMEERDPSIYGDFMTRRRCVLKREHMYDAAQIESARSKKALEFLNDWHQSLDEFDNIAFDMTEAIGFGFACFEMKYGDYDNYRAPIAFVRHPQEWLRLKHQDGTMANAMSGNRDDLRLHDSSAFGQELWAGGWLVHVHKAKSGYLHRASLFRVLGWWYLAKVFAARDNSEFLEIYGIPPRIGKFDPQSASSKDKATLLRAVRELGHSSGGVIPTTMQLELLEAATGSTDAFERVMRYADEQNSKAILGRQVVNSGGLNGGSGANESNNADVADDLNISDCKQLAISWNRDVVRPMLALNFGITDPRECPKFKFETTAPADREAVARGISEVKKAGIVVPTAWAYKQVQVPVPEDGEDVLEAPAPPPSPFGAPQNGGNPAVADETDDEGELDGDPKTVKPADDSAQLSAILFAALAADRKAAPKIERDDMDDMVDAMLAEYKPTMDDVLAPILEAVAKAVSEGHSLGTLRLKLPHLLGKMGVNELADLIAKGNLLANAAGRAGLLAPKSGG
jgi:phage gp29-like protein